MAGIGIGPQEFSVFEAADPGERDRLVGERLEPRLAAIGGALAAALQRVSGRRLEPRVGRTLRRRGGTPGEAWVAFVDGSPGGRGAPFLALAVSSGQLHARVAVRGRSPRAAQLRRALEREAGSLARRGKPFRRLRLYTGWNHDDLPELAAAGSPAFWLEVAESLAPGTGRSPGTDLGIAWPRDEARNLSLGDVLGAFRDLAPLYKLLASAFHGPSARATRPEGPRAADRRGVARRRPRPGVDLPAQPGAPHR